MDTHNLGDTDEFLVPGLPRAPFGGPPSARVEVDLAGLSHQGLVRKNNEDHFLISRFGRYLERLHTNLPEADVPRLGEEVGYALVVADGIGGHVAGEQASQLAIRTLVEAVLRWPDWILRLDEDSDVQEVMQRAHDRFGIIQDALAEEVRNNPGLEGFGSTLTLAYSLGRDLFVGHIGDSRAYLFRAGRLTQLTRDHTMAQALADNGQLAQEEVARHHLKRILTRALGPYGRSVAPEVHRHLLQDGDTLLLCTDGLSDLVQDDAIAEILRAGHPAKAACQELVERALAAGGRDNVTVALARYRFPEGGPSEGGVLQDEQGR